MNQNDIYKIRKWVDGDRDFVIDASKPFNNSENDLIFHYHNYDRGYRNSGYLDEYDSESLTIKAERAISQNDSISFGYGSEYKYDWE